MLQRVPETFQRDILNYMCSFDILNYMVNIVGKVIDFLSLYSTIDVTDIDILKIHEDHMCPDKMLSIIILVIILKCYMSQQ